MTVAIFHVRIASTRICKQHRQMSVIRDRMRRKFEPCRLFAEIGTSANLIPVLFDSVLEDLLQIIHQ